MITTTTRHHETGVPIVLLLPCLAAATTWAVCWAKSKTEKQEDQSNERTSETDTGRDGSGA